MKSKLTKLTLSIILTLTIISLAVVLTLACKPLYYLDIHALHIPETTGCTISEIKANYNAVIDYCLSFGNAPLEFPTFPDRVPASRYWSNGRPELGLGFCHVS